MADTFLFGSAARQVADRILLEKALDVQPSGGTLRSLGEEIRDAVMLAEIAKILNQLVLEEVLAFPLEAVEALQPLVDELPGVRMDVVKQVFPSDSFPIASLDDSLPKWQRAITNYRNYIKPSPEKGPR